MVFDFSSVYVGLFLWQAMASMNRGLNLPQIQKIMQDFEKENSMMDMKEEMMSDAVDDVMDDEAEEEEEEGDKILKEVLDEIGVGLSQQVRNPWFIFLDCAFGLILTLSQLTDAPTGLAVSSPLTTRQPVALGEAAGPTGPSGGDKSGGGDQSGVGLSDEDALQARLDALRRG